jgi:hypothetical protein
MEQQSIEWLIIMVIHDFNHQEYKKIIKEVLAEFTSEGSIGQNRVLLIMNTTEVEGSKVRFKTLFQTLTQESDRSDDPLRFNFIDIPETTVGFEFHEKRGWEKLLGWININYPSQKTILITLSHGAGVGIKGEVLRGALSAEPEFKIIRANEQIVHQSALHPRTLEYFKNCKEDKNCILADQYLIIKGKAADAHCKKLEMLWITELANALENSFGNRKIDILMMSNCFMQTFETGWILRNQVRYLVAPETVFKAYGYSFSGLLKVLNRNPGIKTKELLKTVIPDFIVKMKDKEEKHLQMVAVAIIDLGYYGMLKYCFEQIAGVLQRSTPAQLKQIADIRKTIQNSSDYPLNDRTISGQSNPFRYEYVDFKYLLFKLKEVFEHNVLFTLFSGLFVRISRQAILHLFVGELYTRHDQFINRKFGLQGISIFMPTNKNTSNDADFINCAYFGTRQVTVDTGTEIPLDAFVKTSSWDEFIQKYIIHLSNTNSNL